MNKYVAGIDIGGSHICAGIINLSEGELVANSVFSLPVDSCGNALYIITQWAEAIRMSINATGIEVADVGIAIPGPFDYEHGISTMEGIEKYDSIFGLNITSSLLSQLHDLGVKNILYTNDASAFALGEYFGDAGRGVSRMIGLTLGTGFGSGFIVDGKIVIEGVEVPPNGWVYCLPFEGGVADDEFSTRWFVRRFKELAGVTVNGAREVAELSASEDVAKAIFEEYGSRLARFTLPLIEDFNAETVVLGGNISKAFHLFYPTFEKYMITKGMGAVKVVASQLNDKATLIGAASLFL